MTRLSTPMPGPGIAALLLLGGCAASLDPKPDIDRAASTVLDRSGYRAAWDEPWGDPDAVWDGETPLGVDQAVLLALRNNRAIRAEVEQIGAARADLVQAGLLPNPVLNLTLRFPIEGTTGPNFIGAAVVQEFAALWLRPSRMRAADARLNEGVLSLSDRALRLVADVKQLHARLVYGQRGLALTRSNIEMVEKSIDALERRARAGEGTQLDVNRGRQQLLALRAELGREEREVARDKRRLLEVMGIAEGDSQWEATDQPASWELPADERLIMRLAREQRLDVAASRMVVEARAAELTEQERSRLRELGVGVGYERDIEDDTSIGPVLDVPIPIFDINQAQIAKAGSLARAALATYEAALQRAIAQARVAYVDAENSAALVDLYRREVLVLAEGNLGLAQASLRAGQSDVTVLLEAQREVVGARRSLNQLESEAAQSFIELEYTVGGRLAAGDEPGGDQGM